MSPLSSSRVTSKWGMIYVGQSSISHQSKYMAHYLTGLFLSQGACDQVCLLDISSLMLNEKEPRRDTTQEETINILLPQTQELVHVDRSNVEQGNDPSILSACSKIFWITSSSEYRSSEANLRPQLFPILQHQAPRKILFLLSPTLLGTEIEQQFKSPNCMVLRGGVGFQISTARAFPTALVPTTPMRMMLRGKITFYCERLSSEKSIAANWLDRLEPHVSILNRPNLSALRWGTMAIDLMYYLQVILTRDESSNHNFLRNRYARLIYVQLLYELFGLVKKVQEQESWTPDVSATSMPCSLTLLWHVLPWSDFWFFLLLRVSSSAVLVAGANSSSTYAHDNPVERDLKDSKSSNFHEHYQEWLDLAQEHQVHVPALTYLMSRFAAAGGPAQIFKERRRVSVRDVYHEIGISPESRVEPRRAVLRFCLLLWLALLALGGAYLIHVVSFR